MSRLTAVLVAAVMVGSTTVRAADPAPLQVPTRGPVTGFGIALLVVAGAGLGLGTAGVASLAQVTSVTNVTFGNRSDFTPFESDTITSLGERRNNAIAAIGVGFGLLGAGLIGGLLCILLDQPKLPTVSFAPTPGGASVALSATF